MSEVVPEGWDRTTVGQILEDIADGGTPATSNRDYYDGDIPWIVIDDIKPQIFDTKSKISELGLNKSSAKLWGAGTIILSTGATIGKVGIAMRSMATKQGICGLVPRENANNFFLFHYLSSIEHDLNVLSQGSTIKETRPPTIRNISLSLPPLPEQKKIASILTSVDEVIESTQKQIDKLQDLKKATMNELLTKGIGHTEFKDSELGRIPKSWEVGALAEIAGIVSGYAFSSSDFVDEGTLCIRMGNLYGNNFDEFRSPVYLPHAFIANHPKFSVTAGDLLMSMTGTAGKRDYGFLVEVPDGFEQGLLNQRVSKIIPKSVRAKSFVCELMRSELYLEELFSFGSGTKQANLSASQIMGIKIPIPPLDEQFTIGETISAVARSISEKERKLTQTQSLKKSLMQDLLTGKVRVKVD